MNPWSKNSHIMVPRTLTTSLTYMRCSYSESVSVQSCPDISPRDLCTARGLRLLIRLPCPLSAPNCSRRMIGCLSSHLLVTHATSNHTRLSAARHGPLCAASRLHSKLSSQSRGRSTVIERPSSLQLLAQLSYNQNNELHKSSHHDVP